MTSVQAAMQELTPKAVIPINRSVGESECNGRAEGAIRRIQEKTRSLRHCLDNGTRETPQEDSPIMAWMVHWAFELPSKFAPGEDGKSPIELIRGSTCRTPLVTFGGGGYHVVANEHGASE